MLVKKIKFILIIFLFYQTPLFSKSTSFETKNFNKYFSGIFALENKNNSQALKFFDSSKILINRHNPFLKNYVFSLVLENKVSQAIILIKKNKGKKNTDFIEAYLLLILDSLKKNDFDRANDLLKETRNYTENDRLNFAIYENLKHFAYTFKKKKILKDKKSFGKLSIISETFQRCYLGDRDTDQYFSKIINDDESNLSRYIFFYLNYLIENQRISEAKNISKKINIIDAPLLLLQGKNWIENKKLEKFTNIFSCKNHNDTISEFLFLISNLYSSQGNFEKSNFYLNLSNYLNSKFIYNKYLYVENQYSNQQYQKAQKILKSFNKEDNYFFWYRLKKEAKIIEKLKSKQESLDYIVSEFKKIKNPNEKILFDIANFYKNAKKYNEAIKYYSKVISSQDNNSKIKSDLLYRRGGSYERIGDYYNADKDLFEALRIRPDNAYILNYLAYSWLERNYKLMEAIKMLEKAYALENNDPYIIDSIGWAYYLIQDYEKAEAFLKKAVELMPDDPIVNDHYGDILWKLGRKIQARYFWSNVIKMDDADKDMLENINIKMSMGLKNL